MNRRQVCKQLYVLSKDDTIWRHKYCSEFGAWVPPVQCNPTNGLSWKLKYWFEYNLVQHTRHDTRHDTHDTTRTVTIGAHTVLSLARRVDSLRVQ
jgi:hypothetical protein